MDRMGINGPGADFQIKMRKILSGETVVSKVEAGEKYASSFQYSGNSGKKLIQNPYQSIRWMDRYLLDVSGIKDTDTITIRGCLDNLEQSAHHDLGHVSVRADMNQDMLKQQGEIILEHTGLVLRNYIDLTTRLPNCALCIPFDIKKPYMTVEVDAIENVYIITIQELGFKKQCNEAIRRFLEWCEARGDSPDILFLKQFCDLKSDRKKGEEQKQYNYAYEMKIREENEEWVMRTTEYVKSVNWNEVNINLNYVTVDITGASVELHIDGMPKNEVYKAGILLPEQVQFIEQSEGISMEQQFAYFPDDFKTRLLCMAVKYINQEYKNKYAGYYEYKKWHVVCEMHDFSTEFSKKFTYASDEKLRIVRDYNISFDEWERNTILGTYKDLFLENPVSG